MISHHDVALFEKYADRIYQFAPCGDERVEVRQLSEALSELDRAN
jgi:hypothetical protein